jgi:hypothetical protein
MNGSAKPGERVVIVEVQSGRVSLKTGCISSTDFGALPSEKRNTTVVRADQLFHPVIESSEEAHEREFHVNDIHLLKAQEARSLGVLNTAQDWFGAIYQDFLVTKIQRALKRLNAV